MRILQVLPALEQGGVEWDAVELALELQARGVPNGVASAGGSMVARLDAAGVPHHALPLATKSPFGIIANGLAAGFILGKCLGMLLRIPTGQVE